MKQQLNAFQDFLQRNLWALIMIVIGLIIWSVRLEGQVQVNASQVESNLEDIDTNRALLLDIRERQIRMEKDIEYIRLQYR